MVKLPPTYGHPNKNHTCYPDMKSLYTMGYVGPSVAAMVRMYLAMSDAELLKHHMVKDPRRNPPLRQTNFISTEEEEKMRYPFQNPQYLPGCNVHNPGWYFDAYGIHPQYM